MKIRSSITIFLLLIAVQTSSPNALAQGSITQGEWTLNYPNFSTLGDEKDFVFQLQANGSNELEVGDLILIQIQDVNQKSVGSGLITVKGSSTKKQDVPVDIWGLNARKADLTKFLISKVKVVRGTAASKFKGADLSFQIPSDSFPKKSTIASDLIKLTSDFASKQIEYPTECTKLKFNYFVNDPYWAVLQFDFEIIDSSEKAVAGAYSTGYRLEAVEGIMTLCPSTLESSKGPYRFRITVAYDDDLELDDAIIDSQFSLASPTAKVESEFASNGNICQKGNVFKTLKGQCPSGYKLLTFQSPSKTEWNTLTRSPKTLQGKNYVIYGCVSQFDSTTGGSRFRASALPSPSESFFNGVNSMFNGNAKQLLKLGDSDAFAARVSVIGAYIYSTLGGRTSVPNYVIRDFVLTGSC